MLANFANGHGGARSNRFCLLSQVPPFCVRACSNTKTWRTHLKLQLGGRLQKWMLRRRSLSRANGCGMQLRWSFKVLSLNADITQNLRHAIIQRTPCVLFCDLVGLILFHTHTSLKHSHIQVLLFTTHLDVANSTNANTDNAILRNEVLNDAILNW